MCSDRPPECGCDICRSKRRHDKLQPNPCGCDDGVALPPIESADDPGQVTFVKAYDVLADYPSITIVGDKAFDEEGSDVTDKFAWTGHGYAYDPEDFILEAGEELKRFSLGTGQAWGYVSSSDNWRTALSDAPEEHVSLHEFVESAYRDALDDARDRFAEGGELAAWDTLNPYHLLAAAEQIVKTYGNQISTAVSERDDAKAALAATDRDVSRLASQAASWRENSEWWQRRYAELQSAHKETLLHATRERERHLQQSARPIKPLGGKIEADPMNNRRPSYWVQVRLEDYERLLDVAVFDIKDIVS